MKVRPIFLASAGETFLPQSYFPGHDASLLFHDFLVELLSSAEKNKLFREKFTFSDQAERLAFESSNDVFDWFERTGRVEDRDSFLRKTVFPALLSDLLHFVFSALEASRKAKTAVAYSLLRKPLQESLFVFEAIVLDPSEFASHMVTNPLKLRSQKAGGIDAHAKRISKVLSVVERGGEFDPAYLAQLRYDKNAEDGFDGVCNKAVHLFTGHEAIKTEDLNINFIFSDDESRLSQWSFIYSRLPYLLAYTHVLVEHVFAEFHRSDGPYARYMQRRLDAAVSIWAETIEPHYRSAPIDGFIASRRERLERTCEDRGRRSPTFQDLVRMRRDGRLPGESRTKALLRTASLNGQAAVSKALAALK